MNYFNRLIGILGICVFGFFGFGGGADAAVFVVNSLDDTTDGSCDAFVAGVSDCTFREAVEVSNAAPGGDIINFSIDGSFPDDGDGQYVIVSTSDSPSITDTLEINASANWDVDDDRPGIKFYNNHASYALNFTAGSVNSRVKGMEVDSGSVALNVGGDGSIIGTDCDGVMDASERNVVNISHKLVGWNPAVIMFVGDDVIVRGNYAGVDYTGLVVSSDTNGAAMYARGDNQIIGYEEGTSGVCPAFLQRNIIGSSNGYGIVAGAPVNNLTVAGNYIGVGVDGATRIAAANITAFGFSVTSGNHGVDFVEDSYIGTNGNGIDDNLEGNVIAGWGSHQIFLYRDSKNFLISGNIIGLSSDQSTVISNDTGNGQCINTRSEHTIIGYCDLTVDAALCSAGGDISNMRNVIGGSPDDGIRLGGDDNLTSIYGNLIGVNDFGQDVGNVGNGIDSAKYEGGSVIGAAGANFRNTIRFNDDGGVLFNVCDSDCEYVAVDPTERFVLENNLISDNDSYGVFLDRYEESDGGPDPTEGKILGNSIINNGTYGIDSSGASPDVMNNVITGNGSVGVLVRSTYRHDFQQHDVYDNPYDSMSPNNASNDAIGQPEITGNTIDGNSGGILVVGAEPVNESTLLADNLIGVNGSYDFRKNWYVGVELLENGSVPAGSDNAGVLFQPSGVSCNGVCDGTGWADAGGGLSLYAKAGIDYNDVTTWLELTEFDYDAGGVLVSYSPYTLDLSGYWRTAGASPVVSVDGDMSNDADTGNITAGITTHGLDRYQTYEIEGTYVGHGNDHFKTPIIAPITETAPDFYDINEPEMKVDVNLYLFDGDASIVDSIDLGDTGLPLFAFGFIYFIGHLRSRRKRVTEEEIKIALDRRKAYFAFAIVIGLVIFVSVSGLARYGFADGYLLLDDGDVVGPGDLVRIEYVLENVGGSSARDVHFVSDLGEHLVVSDDGANVYGEIDSAKLDDSLIAWSDEFKNGRTGKIVVDGVVMSSSGLLDFEARVTGSNFDAVVADSVGVVISAERVEAGEGRVFEDGDVVVDVVDSIKDDMDVIIDEETDSVDVRDEIGAPTEAFAPFSLVTGESSKLVYMIDIHGLRRPFRTLRAFESWYKNFDEVKLISDERLDEILLGGYMNIRPGTWLVKYDRDPFVYAVEPDGVLRWISNEEEALRIYGDKWQERIVDISLDMIHDYDVGDSLEVGAYPDGLILSDGLMRCYMDGGECRVLTDSGMEANRFFDRFVVMVDPEVIDGLEKGPIIRSKEPGLLY